MLYSAQSKGNVPWWGEKSKRGGFLGAGSIQADIKPAGTCFPHSHDPQVLHSPSLQSIQPLVFLYVVFNRPAGEVQGAGCVCETCSRSQLFTPTGPKSFVVGFYLNTLAPV